MSLRPIDADLHQDKCPFLLLPRMEEWYELFTARLVVIWLSFRTHAVSSGRSCAAHSSDERFAKLHTILVRGQEAPTYHVATRTKFLFCNVYSCGRTRVIEGYGGLEESMRCVMSKLRVREWNK